ncbi:TPA: GNAT family N-acetyltransferase [Legionella pneumophila]|uniref:GNAT family N-acetyltransferase n=1 Tax=Legionella TaxID=445 RepID=UPI00036D8D7E|nr:GNAT family N-acetyltransferase [Legionella anisa]HAU0230599.1 GNAT family N-acetyltransferase [Legionella pneumophila]
MAIFLSTKRLILTTPKLEDLDEVFELQSDPEVMRYIGDGVRTKAMVATFLNMAIEHYAKHGFSFFSVREKDTNHFIGQAGLIYLGYDDNQPQIEVGYRLHSRYWGKSYATELTSALIKWGFDNLNIPTLMAVVEPNNVASYKVLLKAGMINTGTTTYWNREVTCFEIKNYKLK